LLTKYLSYLDSEPTISHTVRASGSGM
jgi:hypothetical protein